MAHSLDAYGAGPVTPKSDKADGASVGRVGEVREVDTPDFAKSAATAIARAALLGIEARPVLGGAWLLRHARGADIGTVHGIEALEAAVRGFESARDDVRALVQRIGGRV